MTPAAAIPVFLVSIGVMLAASAVFARRLDHIGLRLGLPEAVLGLLTALAADAPELASAVTALVASRHEIAVGVVVGASTFNLAAMLGLSAVVTARIRARHETLGSEDVPATLRTVTDLHVLAVEADGGHDSLSSSAAGENPRVRKPRAITGEPAGHGHVRRQRGTESARKLATIDVQSV